MQHEPCAFLGDAKSACRKSCNDSIGFAFLGVGAVRRDCYRARKIYAPLPPLASISLRCCQQ
jgi:hypothetical protein